MKPDSNNAKSIKQVASMGGIARARTLSKAQLSAIGRKAVMKRWEAYRAAKERSDSPGKLK